MRNPLIKRIPRELVKDWHKYFVIIVFMVIMIGVISGMYVGHDSMLAAVYENRESLNLEDGSFELARKATQDLLDDLSSGEMAEIPGYASDEPFVAQKVSIYEHFYREEEEDINGDGVRDATVRIYKSDSVIDKAAFNKGRAPEKASEIAIDRMHADNVGLKVGDTVTIGGSDFEIVGLLSYVNYLTLHEKNSDLMFDSFGFDVAMVTPEAFDRLTSRVHYGYAWQYETKPEDKPQLADASEDFLKALFTQTLVHGNEIMDYLPEYLRQASNFAISDIEGDSAGASILCYILIGVIAFIFAITTANTIDGEASVIGTLRASGYGKGEMIVHYLSMPIIVTILGAVIGNVLGYTAFKNVALNLYYNSYSLPSCHAVWSNTALVKTTVIPLLLMFFINLFVITRKLQLSPLRFLRHDLTNNKRTKARRLPGWSFLKRFRLRILFQNMPNYVVLIFGVTFIELMLSFAFGLPDSLDHYGEQASEMMIARYQYVLMDCKDEEGNVIETAEKSAERVDVTSLMYPKGRSTFREGMGSGGDEKVTVFGMAEGSAYVKLGNDAKDGRVYVSSAFQKKFGLTRGETIRLHEEYENKSYEFQIAGTVDYDGGIAIFMNHEGFCKQFDKSDDEFSGFFSREKITDIDEQSIAAVITAEDLAKVTNQLKHSIGGAMEVFKYALIVLTAALIYLLAKIIIERNEHSISMVKILGFRNGEIGSLYIAPTALLVVIFTLIGFVIGHWLMTWVFSAFMLQMDGYFAFYESRGSMVLSILFLLIGYAFVSVIDFIRIKRIPLNVALKNVE